MNANDILFRSHMIGEIMPSDNARVAFTQVAMDKMVEIYNFTLFGRREEIKSKFLEKGNEREEDSITLLSRLTKTVYRKNEDRLENKYISGVPDLFEGEEIRKSVRTIDTKTSWSKNTFDKARVKPLEKDYLWQGQGYMALTGAKSHTVAYCLVNGTAKLILDEKKKLLWNMSEHDERYKKKCRQIEINHIFDIKHFIEENPGFDFDNDIADWTYDIPMVDRLFQFHILRDDVAIEKMYKRIKECRNWMTENLFKAEAVAA